MRTQTAGWKRYFSGLGAITLACAALMTAPSLGEGQGPRRGFTSEEQQSLESGGLVVRRQARRRGDLHLIGGTSYQVINRTPEEVWRAVLDTPRYTRFLPQLREARVIERATNRKLVFLRHAQGPVDASYFITQQLEHGARTLHFRVDPSRPSDLGEGWGFIQVAGYATSKAIVTFGIFADVGQGILAGLVRPSIHYWMMQVPALLKRYLRGSGRHRYRS